MSEDCEELKRQLALARRQLEAVQRVSAALYSVMDVEALQRLALETAMDVVEAESGSVLIYDPERQALVFQHVIGPVAERLRGTELDLTLYPGIAGQVFRTGQSRITNDVRDDQDHTAAVDKRTGYQTHSLMTVPIRPPRLDTIVGVIQFINKRSGEFDASDVAVVETMVSLIAMALLNVQLAREAKLAAVARSVGEIGHDIGNMLTNVQPYVESLEGFIEDVRAGKPGAVEALDDFYKEVRARVADGVEQVQERTRELARAVKGEVAPIVLEPGQPLKTAQRVAQSLSGPAGRRGVDLRVEGDEALEAVYDHRRLFDALYNLVNNAVPETPPGGSVTVSVRADDDPSYYRVSVADTGRGMPEEIRATLFTDAARSTKPGGTGLGTRMVRRVVEQHGGAATVESAPHAGTTVTLRLPKRPVQSSQL